MPDRMLQTVGQKSFHVNGSGGTHSSLSDLRASEQTHQQLPGNKWGFGIFFGAFSPLWGTNAPHTGTLGEENRLR
jgi:hypothetical protein